jgi:hypothetical protein
MIGDLIRHPFQGLAVVHGRLHNHVTISGEARCHNINFLFTPEIGEHDLGTGYRQPSANDGADATCGTRHNGDLPRHQSIMRHWFPSEPEQNYA